MKVVVIGAGLGGLSAAAHLVGAGHQVTIVEREAIPGGRAGMIVSEGFRLDNGPTVLTMPNLLEDAFNACGTDMADHLTIHPVDPMYRAVFADGSTLFVRHGREAMTQEIREFSDAEERRSVRPVLRLAREALPGRDELVHRRQLQHAARSHQAAGSRASNS